jgi:hypothetical protein
LYFGRFAVVHIGGPSSNQAAFLESQPIHQIQLLFGRTRLEQVLVVPGGDACGQLAQLDGRQKGLRSTLPSIATAWLFPRGLTGRIPERRHDFSGTPLGGLEHPKSIRFPADYPISSGPYPCATTY